MLVDIGGRLVAQALDGFNIIPTERSGTRMLVVPEPVLGINHTYSIFVPVGKDNDPARDGTLHCAKSYSSGKATYGPPAYLARGSTTPGHPGADIYPMTSLLRRNLHCEGRVKLKDPQFLDAHGVPYFNNDCSVGLETAGSGWWREDGTDWSGPAHKRSIWDKIVISFDRPDFKKVGRFYWQELTPAQVYTMQRFWAAVVARFPSLKPEHCVHGHEEMGSGGHMCPGPLVMAALKNQVLPYLLGARPKDIVPVLEPQHIAEWEKMFSPDALFSIDPADWFAQMGGRATVDQAEAQFSIGELDLLSKSGWVTHDDEANQVCDPDVWVWVDQPQVQP